MSRQSFEDLPSLYNDFLLCESLRIPSVGGSLLGEPPVEDIQPGKLFVALLGTDAYRGVVQHVKWGKMFKVKLDLGNKYSLDRLIDTESILSITRCTQEKRCIENSDHPHKEANPNNIVKV